MSSRSHARAGTESFLYQIGGRDTASSTFRSDLWVASIATTTWAQATMIPQTRGNGVAVAWGPYLYFLGGQNDSNPGAGLPHVWVTTIDAAGAPLGWTATSSLCAGRFGLGVVAASGNLYAFGGASGSAASTTTSCFTTIDPASGALQPWAETTPLPSMLRNPLVVATDDHVFLVGGCANTAFGTAACGDGAAVGTGVYAAQVLPDGNLGDWLQVSMLPDALSDRGATIYDGRIYIVGGTHSQTRSDAVWTALIEYGGKLGAWTAATPAHVLGSSTNPHRRPGVNASNGRLYVFEYDDSVNETISAPLE
jgi:N-acetylneuraminic acid mutarotase